MRTPLRAGIALFNAGYHHAAHDAWEDHWLELPSDTPDERVLHGLIQFTAAVYHLGEGNLEGATGLAESAREYLDGLGGTYEGVALDPVRDTLERIAEEPDAVDLGGITPLRHEEEPLDLEDLAPDARWVAAEILAEEVPAYDAAILRDAVIYAQEGGPENRFFALVTDFLAREGRRPVVYERLRQHVERERDRREEVSGLFEDDPE